MESSLNLIKVKAKGFQEHKPFEGIAFKELGR
jgi:hypothetical protein